jgi:hypothetical protein
MDSGGRAGPARLGGCVLSRERSHTQEWSWNSGTGALRNDSHKLCLDVNGLQLRPCNGSASQKWQYNAGTGVLKSRKSNRCLQATDKKGGTERGRL